VSHETSGDEELAELPGRWASPRDGATLAGLWRSVLPSAAELRAARRRLHIKAIGIVGLVVVSYWGLVVADVPDRMRFVCAAALVTGLIAVATNIMHDANHGGFSRRAWLNRVVGYSSDALGASSWLWRFKHNILHHANTNVGGVDTDILQAPFARLAPSQPWRRWHRGQHVYLWFLYGFMVIKNVFISDICNLARACIGGQPLRRRPRPRDIGAVLTGKAVHVSWALVVPLFFHSWWVVLTFYFVCSWIVGLVLAVTFQLAHCVDLAEFPDGDAERRGDQFVTHQLLTTADVASHVPLAGHAFRWLVGGLDHQIEHHLAPRLPHTIYPWLAARFRRKCAEVGINCRIHGSVWQALCSHARWLKTMGQPTIPSVVRV
jgi:linoleoyl-CoA desaturase